MGIWDEIMGLTARTGARQATREGGESGARGALSASPRMLRKARKRSAWDDVSDNVGSFFKGAGVLGKNVADTVIHPIDNLPYFGKGNSNGLQEALAATRERSKSITPIDTALRLTMPWLQIPRGTMPSVDPLVNAVGAARRGAEVQHISVPDHPATEGFVNAAWNLPPMRIARAAAHPVDSWNSLRNGVSPNDGNFEATLGSRSLEKWQRLQDDAARVAEADHGKPFVQRAAEAVLPDAAAQYFDPNAEDVFSTAQKAGYSPADSLGISMSNPLEWLGSEGGAGIAGKLKNAGRARKVLNTVGRAMDPAQLALEGAGKVISKGREAIDWALPSTKKASNGLLSPDEVIRRTGVDPEQYKSYIGERASATPDAPLATNATEAMDSTLPARANNAEDVNNIWDSIVADESMGDATRSRIAGLVDETNPYYDSIARNSEPEPAYRDTQSIPEEAPLAPRDDAFLFDQAQQAANESEAGLDFQRQQSVYSAAKEAQVGRKLSELTPGLPQSNVEDALRWLDGDAPPMAESSLEDALRASDPGAANPRYSAQADPLLSRGEPSPQALDAAMNTPKSWGDLLLNEGDAGAQARQIAPTLPVPLTEMDSSLAKLTPSILPNETEQDLRWLDGVDEGAVNGEAATQEVLGRLGRPEDVGLSRMGLEQPGAADVAMPGSAAVDMVGDVAAPGSKGTLQGGLRLNSNPIAEWAAAGWKGIRDAAMGRTGMAVEKFLGSKVIDPVVESSKFLRESRDTIKRYFTEDYGKAGPELSRQASLFRMRDNSIIRGATETVAHQLNVGTPVEKALLKDYMNGTLTRQEVLKGGLSPEMIQAGDGVRFLMDNSGGRLIESGIGLEHGVLTKASNEEKRLMAEVYDSFNNPKKRANVLASATASHSQPTILRAQNLIDGAMQRMEAQGMLKDGKIMDLPLDPMVWVQNLGKYEPQMYKLIEYGIDVSSPTAMVDFVNEVESRHARAAEMYNEVSRAAGKPEFTRAPIPDDIKRFLLSRRTGQGSWSKAAAEEAGRFMKRKDISPALREILAPIVDPAYTYTKGVEHVHRTENIMKMRRWVADSENLVSRQGEKIEDFLKRTGSAPEDIAYDFADNPQYAAQVGPLAGRFIHRDAADLMAVTGMIPHLHGAGNLESFKAMTKAWLAPAKVILNPASHARQALQNMFTTYVNLGARAAVDMPASIRDLANKSQEYIEARGAGLFSAGGHDDLIQKIDLESMPDFNFDGSDLALAKLGRHSEWLGAFSQSLFSKQGLKRTFAKGMNKASASFAFMDDLAKMAAFKHFRRQGKSVEDAAFEASKNVFTGSGHSRYSRLQSGGNIGSTFFDRGATKQGRVNFAEGFGLMAQSPFFGATQFVYDTAIKSSLGIRNGHWLPMTDPGRAMRLWGMVATGYAMGEMSKYMGGVTTEQETREKPDTLRTLMPTHATLPPQMTQLVFGDGRMAWWDFNSIVPYGQPTQGKFDLKSGRMTGMLDNLASTFIPGAGLVSKVAGDGSNVPINPLFKPMVEMAINRDLYSDRHIVEDYDSTIDKIRKETAYAVRSYLPPWVPNPVGLLKSIEESPNAADMGDPEQWKRFVSAGVQGVLEDSGHQFSKLGAGVINSINYDPLVEKLRQKRVFLDYQGRDTYLAQALFDAAGIRLVGVKSVTHEVEKQRGYRMDAIEKDWTKTVMNKIRNEDPVAQARAKQHLKESIRELRSRKPSLRFYETPTDAFTNILRATKTVMDRYKQVKPEDLS